MTSRAIGARVCYKSAMGAFITRFLAVLLSGSVFVAGAVLVAQLHPESVGGWGVLALFAAGALTAPLVVYRLVTAPLRRSGLPDEGEGAGLLMGAGIDRGRRREDGDDPFDLD